VGLVSAITLLDTAILRFAPSVHAENLATAVSTDLTFGFVAVGWLFLVRRARWPKVVLVPVLLAGVALAAQVVPAQQHQTLNLIGQAGQVAELGLVAFGVWKAIAVLAAARASASASGDDLWSAVRTELSRPLGARAAGILATEMAVVAYGLGGWFQKPRTPPGAIQFRTLRGWVPLLFAIVLILLVETLAIHLLVSLVAPAVAWIFTALSLYGLLWLVADGQAARLRPILVTDTDLLVRVGLRWTVSVPRSLVRSVGPVGHPITGIGDRLVMAMDGQPTVEVVVREPVTVHGPLGIERRADCRAIGLDDPRAFIAAMTSDQAISSSG
jgi:hypothetical protein